MRLNSGNSDVRGRLRSLYKFLIIADVNEEPLVLCVLHICCINRVCISTKHPTHVSMCVLNLLNKEAINVRIGNNEKILIYISKNEHNLQVWCFNNKIVSRKFLDRTKSLPLYETKPNYEKWKLVSLQSFEGEERWDSN